MALSSAVVAQVMPATDAALCRMSWKVRSSRLVASLLTRVPHCLLRHRGDSVAPGKRVAAPSGDGQAGYVLGHVGEKVWRDADIADPGGGLGRTHVDLALGPCDRLPDMQTPSARSRSRRRRPRTSPARRPHQPARSTGKPCRRGRSISRFSSAGEAGSMSRVRRTRPAFRIWHGLRSMRPSSSASRRIEPSSA